MNEQELDSLRALAQQRQSTAEAARCPVIIREIAEAVGLAFGVPTEEIFGRDKHKSISEARVVTCYVARKCTRMSFPELGRAMGLDQSTVRSAVLSVQARRERDRWTDSVCALLLEQFGAIEESATQ